jgi:putative redox protein
LEEKGDAMAETTVLVRQDRAFRIEFLTTNPEGPADQDPEPVEAVAALTPFGMLLASLGACTTVVVHTYAQHHGIPLDLAEIRLRYLEPDAPHGERIQTRASFQGELTDRQRKRLESVSRSCSIHKILEHGISVESMPDPA